MFLGDGRQPHVVLFATRASQEPVGERKVGESQRRGFDMFPALTELSWIFLSSCDGNLL